jgi:hypothetical protein
MAYNPSQFLEAAFMFTDALHIQYVKILSVVIEKSPNLKQQQLHPYGHTSPERSHALFPPRSPLQPLTPKEHVNFRCELTSPGNMWGPYGTGHWVAYWYFTI